MSRLRLGRIRVENFGLYTREELDIDGLDQPLLVLGQNGAGKTTFFVDALTYGAMRKAYERESGVKRLASRYHLGGQYEAKAVVELVSDDGVIYVFNNGRGNMAIGSSSRKAPSFEELTGHTYASLLKTYIVRQGRTEEPLYMKEKELRNLLIEILDINFFNKVRDRVAKDLKSLGEEMKELQSVIDELKGWFRANGLEEITLEAIEEYEESIKDELRSKEEELERVEKRLGELREEKGCIEKRIGNLSDVKAIYRDVKSLEAQIEKRRRELPEEYRDVVLDELDTLIEDIEALVEKVDDYISLVSSIERAKSVRDELTKLRERLEREVDGKSIDELSEELSQTLEDISALETIKRQLEKGVEELRKAGDKCPVCGSELTEEHRNSLIKSYTEQIRVLDERIPRLKETYNALEKRLKTARKLEKEISKKEGEYGNSMKSIRDRYGDILSELGVVDIDGLIERVGELSKTFLERLVEEADRLGIMIDPSLHRDIKRFRDGLIKRGSRAKSARKVLEHLSREMGRLESLKETLDRKMDELDLTEDMLDRLGKLIEEGRSRIVEIENNINSLEEERANLQREIGVLSERLKDVDEMRKKYGEYVDKGRRLEEVASEIEVLEVLDKVFAERGFPNYFVNNVVVPNLERMINIFLEEMSSLFRINLRTTEHGVRIEVLEANRKREINTLSGGEVTLIGLAFRLGLGNLISQLGGKSYTLDFMVFDEAFPHLDREKKNAVLETIGELINNGLLSQVIVITHDFEIRSSQVFNSVVEVYREGEVSRLRVVEAV